MSKCRENVIEFLKDEQQAGVTFSQGRYKSRIRALAKKYPDECQIVAENKDGSIYAHIPVTWIRINPNRVLSEEQQEVRRRNVQKAINVLSKTSKNS